MNERAARAMCAFSLAASVAAASQAEEWRFEAYQCSLEVPDTFGWQELDPDLIPGAVWAAKSPDQKKTLTLAIVRSPHESIRVCEEFNSGVRKALRTSKRFGGTPPTILSDRSLKVQGVPAYEVVASTGWPAAGTTFLQRVLVANGYGYIMNAMVVGDDVTKDSQVAAVLSSFRFLKPPEVPAAKSIPKAPARTTGYLVGYYVAYYGPLVFFGGLGLLIAWTLVIGPILRRVMRRDG